MRYTEQQREEFKKRIEENKDLSVSDLIKDLGISAKLYYDLKRKSVEKPTTKRAYNKKPSMQILNVPPVVSEKVFVFYGTPNEVAEVVRNLR